MMTENTCTECGLTKPIAGFNKHKGMSRGYYNQCRVCMSQARRNRLAKRTCEDPISGLLQRWGRA